MENHDEERIISVLSKEKSKAAAIAISTIQGMKFYNDGQFEGKRIKLPVQLIREPEENSHPELKKFYVKLLKICSHSVFKEGIWKLLTPIPSWETNFTYQNILAWEWRLRDEHRVVIINYSEFLSTCRVKLDVAGYPEELQLTDLLNEMKYNRSAEEIHSLGLYVELKPWHAHIFSL